MLCQFVLLLFANPAMNHAALPGMPPVLDPKDIYAADHVIMCPCFPALWRVVPPPYTIALVLQISLSELFRGLGRVGR